MTLRELLESWAADAAFAAQEADRLCESHYLDLFESSENDEALSPKHHPLRLLEAGAVGKVPMPGLRGPVSAGPTKLQFEVESDARIDRNGNIALDFTRRLVRRSSRIRIRATYGHRGAVEGIQIVQEAMHAKTRNAMRTALTQVREIALTPAPATEDEGNA